MKVFIAKSNILENFNVYYYDDDNFIFNFQKKSGALHKDDLFKIETSTLIDKYTHFKIINIYSINLIQRVIICEIELYTTD